MSSKKTELFFRMDSKEIPWAKEDAGYSSFWEKERFKVERGIEIDGFKMSGWLYWHINHWRINADKMTDWGEIVPDSVVPYLRDNEIILDDLIKEAEKDRKGIVIMGLRQFAKTTMESSYAGRAGVLFGGSQNLIMGTNADDLNNITQNLDFGLLNCTPYFRIPRISRDWDSERVLLGVKNKQGDNFVHSTYVIRNTSGGKKTEKGAGVSNLKCNLWDEIGKDDFLQALIGTKPAMLSEYGWRTIPICVGTGGNVEKARDAKELFFNPGNHNFLSFTQEDGRVTGAFLEGWLRQDCKYKTSLANYLIISGRIETVPKDSELWEIEILVSDKEKAIQKITKELEAFLNSGDLSSYNRWKAYYPLNIDDVFLSESNNSFPIDACKARKTYLEKEYTPEYLELFRDDKNKVGWKFSSKKPICKFPVKPSDNKDAPICVYERPESNVPHGTYCIGVDPYNEDVSSDKINSLGSVEVYKRMYNPMGTYQNQTVATWAGRCKSVREFHELVLMIAEWYNAIEGVLPENEDKTLIQYFFLKKKGHYLADSMELANEINPRTMSKRSKGLSASTNNQRHGMKLIVEDAKDEVEIIEDDGTPEGKIYTVIGVNKINDPMQLEEMIQYRGKPSGSKGVHDGNYDRIISRYLALILARYYDVKYPSNWRPKKQEETNIHKEPIIKTPFGYMTKGSLFIKSKPYHSKGTTMFPR